MRVQCLLALLFTQIVHASPWMTGPLFAPSGKTLPAGKFKAESYGFHSVFPNQSRTFETRPILQAGFNDFLDVQFSIPYEYNWQHDAHSNSIGDVNLGLGIQLLKQRESPWRPNLRLLVQEIVPTGQFEELNASRLGTDQTGLGAYQTIMSLNFQHLAAMKSQHFLRTRFRMAMTLPNKVKVHGANAFGGGELTAGRVSPGKRYSWDLAFEYSLTEHWVPVFEVLYFHNNATTFNGNPGLTAMGTVARVGDDARNQASLAPALEYNINAQLGIIGGIWFSVTGPHATQFTSTVIAINYFF